MRKSRATMESERLPGAEIRLGRRYPSLPIAVPRSIVVEKQCLHWTALEGFDYREPCFETLRDFVELADASDAAILNFAKRWGILGFCKHWLPLTHEARTASRLRYQWCEPERDRQTRIEGGGWDRLSLWREYASEARAILEFAIAALEGRRVEYRLVEWVVYRNKDARSPAVPKVRASWAVVSRGVMRWLEWGDVRPVLVPDRGPSDSRACSIRYSGAATAVEVNGLRPECFRLFGALALELMQAVSRDTIAAHCRGDCGGRIFERTRSNQVYCERCRKNGARVRMAQQRRYRKRKTGG